MQRRGNVILLGDSLGDLNMAKGAGSGEVITVGFLNDKVGHRLLVICTLHGSMCFHEITTNTSVVGLTGGLMGTRENKRGEQMCGEHARLSSTKPKHQLRRQTRRPVILVC